MHHTQVFIDRMKKEGTFKQFSQRKRELEKEGKSKHDAWTAAAREFGWTGDVADNELRQERAQFITKSLGKIKNPESRDDLPDEVTFACNNMHRIPDPADVKTWQIKPEDCPSPLHWTMLMYAAQRPEAFMGKVTAELFRIKPPATVVVQEETEADPKQDDGYLGESDPTTDDMLDKVMRGMQ